MPNELTSNATITSNVVSVTPEPIHEPKIVPAPPPMPLPVHPVTPVPPKIVPAPPPMPKPIMVSPVASNPATPPQNAPTTPVRALTVGPTIAIVNQSSVLTNAQVSNAVAAAQIQIDRDFAPAWNISGNLVFIQNTALPTGAWVIQILDTSDEQGALGYHELTTADVPTGKIFAKDDEKYGLSWTVTLTHEILETLGDPWVDSTVFIQESNTTGTLVALENCDPVEDDSFGYLINGVLVTDFVFPAFFEANRAPNSTKFDFCGKLNAPLSIGTGGYMSIFPVNPKTQGWTQQTGAEGVGKRLAAKSPQSRKARRCSK